jgi:hypothetical protein
LILTADGRARLADLGVDVPGSDSVRCCVDWTEQRHHISGAHGRTLLARMLELDWLRRARSGRALLPTDAGLERLRDVFGISLTDELVPA